MTNRYCIASLFLGVFVIYSSNSEATSFTNPSQSLQNLSQNAQTDFSEDAASHIMKLHERVAAELAGAALSHQERQGRFRKMLRETFDIDQISKFVLGSYWRTANQQQLSRFKNYFEDLLVQSYADSFKSYTGRNFKIQKKMMAPQSGMALITTVVEVPKKGSPSEMAPLEIEWRIKHTPNGYKIVDVTVENVSLSITKRQDFASIIQRGGGQVEALIQALEKQTQATRQS